MCMCVHVYVCVCVCACVCVCVYICVLCVYVFDHVKARQGVFGHPSQLELIDSVNYFHYWRVHKKTLQCNGLWR